MEGKKRDPLVWVLVAIVLLAPASITAFLPIVRVTEKLSSGSSE